ALREMTDTEVCCGFGGTFCVKYPEISTKMVDDNIRNALDTGAEAVLAGDLGCLMNIAGRLRRINAPMRVFHTAEVLAGMASGTGIGGAGKELDCWKPPPASSPNAPSSPSATPICNRRWPA